MRKTIFILSILITLAGLSSFTAKNKITVFTIGDSTMAPKDTVDNPERGWAMAFPLFFDTAEVRFENHARNGRSAKSFIDEGRWKTVMDKLKKGDYVFIEFGHNDEKIEQEKLYAAPNGAYKENLTRFVRETREKGAFPVLMTPIVRRHFDENGMLKNTHGEYPDAVRTLAKELNVPMIDMEKKSREVVQKLGDEASKKLFVWFDAGVHKRFRKGKKDDTHLNVTGATVIAGLAVDGIREAGLPLEKHLLPLVYTYECENIAITGKGIDREMSVQNFSGGTPIPEWFLQTEATGINKLGKHYIITDFGVANDSAIIQTKKIQLIIEKAFVDGGGVVIVPKGTFLSGSLFFKQGGNEKRENRRKLI